MSTQLTITQQAVLAHAHAHTEGKIVWLPDNIKGGACKKVIEGLATRDLITSMSNDWYISTAGYAAFGVARRAPISIERLDQVIKAATRIKPRTRDTSKQAQVIAMLKRPEGATIAQIVKATGWQTHTVRGTFAGSIKKKLGLSISSTKAQGAERVYYITNATGAA